MRRFLPLLGLAAAHISDKSISAFQVEEVLNVIVWEVGIGGCSVEVHLKEDSLDYRDVQENLETAPLIACVAPRSEKPVAESLATGLLGRERALQFAGKMTITGPATLDDQGQVILSCFDSSGFTYGTYKVYAEEDTRAINPLAYSKSKVGGIRQKDPDDLYLGGPLFVNARLVWQRARHRTARKFCNVVARQYVILAEQIDALRERRHRRRSTIRGGL